MHNTRHFNRASGLLTKNYYQGGLKYNPSPSYYRKKRHKKRQITPISSNGIILYIYDTEKKVYKFLVYQRRDSFEYIDFLRGFWSNKDQVQLLLHYMTREEKERLKNYNIRDLWDDLWVSKDLRVYTEGFDKASQKFNSVLPDVKNILSQESGPCQELLWGFPKGKINTNETEVECALREFEEETTIPQKDITLISTEPFTEIYRGTNNKIYSTKYFLAVADKEFYIKTTLIESPIRKEFISGEVSDIKWITYREATIYLSKHKIALLNNVMSYITLNKSTNDPDSGQRPAREMWKRDRAVGPDLDGSNLRWLREIAV